MIVTAIRTQTGLPVLHQQALYGLAGEIVEGLSPFTEAADAGVLFTLLAGFGAMVGNTPYVQAGSRQAARLWPLLVGPTGTGRKGTTWTAAKMVLWYADRRFIDCNIQAGGLSTGEGLIQMVRDGEGLEGPVTKRAQTPDQGVVDKRKLIVEPEFARTLAASRRDQNTLSAVLREAWEGSSLAIATRTKPLKATSPHIVVIAHCTATELRTRLDDTDLSGGLVNRFLLVAVRRSKLLASGDKPPDTMLRTMGDDVRKRLIIAKDGPTRLYRTTDAAKLWETLYHDHLNPELDDDGPFAQAITRGAAYVARLSLVYALLDGSGAIEAPHVAAAAAAWDYCVATARMLFDSSKPLGESDDVARAEAYVRACGENGATRSKLSTLFKRIKSAAELDGLTQQMIAGGNVVYGPIPDKSRHPVLLWVAGDLQISKISGSLQRPRAP